MGCFESTFYVCGWNLPLRFPFHALFSWGGSTSSFFFFFRHQQQLNVRRMHLILNTVLDYTYDIFVSVNVCVCMYVFVCCKAFNFLYIIALHSFDYYTSRLIGSEEEINFTTFIINIAGISCWVNKSIWNVCMCVCVCHLRCDRQRLSQIVLVISNSLVTRWGCDSIFCVVI